jgi:hypothetical protein
MLFSALPTVLSRPRKGATMPSASDVIGTLPFVRNKPDGGGRQFWYVTPTGDREVDIALGHGFAVLALEMTLATRTAGLMGWVMGEMGRNPEWRHIELGFIRGIADLACVTLAMAKGNQSCACAALTARTSGVHHVG